jgi:UDP-N-acetyl-D-glucosamine dehydrogenase
MTSPEPSSETFTSLSALVAERRATVAVIGLGYVGLPLAVAIAQASFTVVGFDVDAAKIDRLNTGQSYIYAVESAVVAGLIERRRFRANADFRGLAACDVIVICVPTPLAGKREPDLSFVTQTVHTIAKYLRPGQLIVLESTTFPGTTEGIVKPILEQGGLRSGRDFFLGFSPEREDPGNATHRTVNTPKIVAGDGWQAQRLVESFYGAVVERVVPVSTPAVAEAVKITENIFRAINIALINELKIVYTAMGIDIWEVVEAAASKPFGFMPFYPGPGLGGHCIPIDPFYLTWKARKYGIATRLIELAGEINVAMPHYVVERLRQAMAQKFSQGLGGARVLILGVAYKKNVADTRESPAFKIIELLEEQGARADFHDPHVAVIPATREHPALKGRGSIALDTASLAAYKAAIIVADHDGVDYGLVMQCVPLVVDTRNVIARSKLGSDNVVKA